MAFWWAGSRQQQGRVGADDSPDCPNSWRWTVRALPREKLGRARAIIRRFRGRPLLPANEAWRDRARQALDRALLVELLDLPEDVLESLDHLRRQWCAEPSVHGGKPHRPARRDVTMPRTSEAAFNTRFAEVLRGKHPLWREHLGVERTGVFPDAPRLRPDVLVLAPDTQPVAIETEWAPAQTVEADARARLGKRPTGSEDAIEQAVAVRVPDSLRRGQADLAERIAAAEFDYCVFSGDPGAPERWPAAGWLAGGVDDIARCVEHAMVSQRRIVESMSILEDGVRVAARAVRDATERGFPDVERNFGRILNQRAGEQTTRMAMTVLVNALTFHIAISGAHAIPSFSELRSHPVDSFQWGILQAWRRILVEINYWPIFEVARKILAQLRARTAMRALPALADAAERLASIGVTTRHDLSGRMFQNLIVDRKFLATFYTLPNSGRPARGTRHRPHGCGLERPRRLSGARHGRPVLRHGDAAVGRLPRRPCALTATPAATTAPSTGG